MPALARLVWALSNRDLLFVQVLLAQKESQVEAAEVQEAARRQTAAADDRLSHARARIEVRAVSLYRRPAKPQPV